MVQKKCPLFKNSCPHCCHPSRPAMDSPISQFQKVLPQFSQLSTISFALPWKIMYVSSGITVHSSSWSAEGQPKEETLGQPYSFPPSEHTLPSGQLRASPTLPPSWYQASGPLLLNTVSAPMWQHLETILLQYGTSIHLARTTMGAK